MESSSLGERNAEVRPGSIGRDEPAELHTRGDGGKLMNESSKS
jgi:hypothetical protein